MSANDIGDKMYIATGIPATFDAAGYVALTWVQVKGVVSIGEVGDSDAGIAVPDLETGRVGTLKGATTGRVVPVALRDLKGMTDAGQVAVTAAALTDNEYSFKFTKAEEGAVITEYQSGPVMSWTRTARTTTSFAGHTFEAGNNYGVIVVIS